LAEVYNSEAGMSVVRVLRGIAGRKELEWGKIVSN